jgi:hypothetical protein
LYVKGVGLKNFKECERTFCLSNNLATVTQLSTPFHRQQQIDEPFNFHDFDKHVASGELICSQAYQRLMIEGNLNFQNYHQATEKIALNEVHLEALKRDLHTSAVDYETYLVQECEHLEQLKCEPPDVVWTVE